MAFPGITVDGNDVVAVYRVAQEAIARARRGQGPTLIECKTYRWYGHSEIDPAKYRDPEEVERWKAKDPIAGWRRYLTGKGLFTAEWKQEIVDGFNKELDAAIEIAEKSSLPEGIEALDHVYSFDIRDRVLNLEELFAELLREKQILCGNDRQKAKAFLRCAQDDSNVRIATSLSSGVCKLFSG
jgi:TPP-dependent pyruvate/acetoin dehydrogenase alpha subunit